jgi:hypothetical protein
MADPLPLRIRRTGSEGHAWWLGVKAKTAGSDEDGQWMRLLRGGRTSRCRWIQNNGCFRGGCRRSRRRRRWCGVVVVVEEQEEERKFTRGPRK